MQASEQAGQSNSEYLLVYLNEIQAIDTAVEDSISIPNTLNWSKTWNLRARELEYAFTSAQENFKKHSLASCVK